MLYHQIESSRFLIEREPYKFLYMSVTQNIRGLKCKEHLPSFQKRNSLVLSSLIQDAKVISRDCFVLDFLLFVTIG